MDNPNFIKDSTAASNNNNEADNTLNLLPHDLIKQLDLSLDGLTDETPNIANNNPLQNKDFDHYNNQRDAHYFRDSNRAPFIQNYMTPYSPPYLFQKLINLQNNTSFYPSTLSNTMSSNLSFKHHSLSAISAQKCNDLLMRSNLL